jgi:hypothetical protein
VCSEGGRWKGLGRREIACRISVSDPIDGSRERGIGYIHRQ